MLSKALEMDVCFHRGLAFREHGGRAPLLVTPKDMLSKALEMDVCFHRGPAFGEHGGTPLP